MRRVHGVHANALWREFSCGVLRQHLNARLFVYGPVQFDSGRGTPIVAAQSWMQYKAMADRAGVTLVPNTFAGDASLLAWAPLESASARL